MPAGRKFLIVSEGVFSMEGDIADLRGIVRLAKLYGPRIYVDEAMASGAGLPRGAAEHWAYSTMSTSFMGSSAVAFGGGFVPLPPRLSDYLKHTPAFVFQQLRRIRAPWAPPWT